MAIHEILQIGDPRLAERSVEVDVAELKAGGYRQLEADLIETMRAANGAGLAAPQIGVLKRVVALEVGDNPRYPYKPKIPLTVAYNPVITPLTDETFENYEGCLSVPVLRGIVHRYMRIRVDWFDSDGTRHSTEAHGLTAGTWQHECDHLDGLLFPNRVTDASTFCTWDNFKTHHQEAFVDALRRSGALT